MFCLAYPYTRYPEFVIINIFYIYDDMTLLVLIQKFRVIPLYLLANIGFYSSDYIDFRGMNKHVTYLN